MAAGLKKLNPTYDGRSFLGAWFLFSVACFIMTLSGCNSGESSKTIIVGEKKNGKKDTSTLPAIDNIAVNHGRTAWQKPDIVIRKMGDLSGKVVADIGTGTGYFAFRLASRADKVIAIDIDSSALDTIRHYIPRMPQHLQAKIEPRLAKPNDPMLKPGEADLIIIINTIAYITNVESYLSTIKKGLAKGGEIVIVDYKMKKLPGFAPPRSERIYLDVLENMVEKAGFVIQESDDTTLDYQYILKAINP